MSLLHRNLFSAVTLRYQAGEFRQERIGSDQQNLSRGVPIEQCKSRRPVRFGQHPFRRDTAVQNKRVGHALSLPIPANQERTGVEWRQGGCKPVQFLPQMNQLPAPLRFGGLRFQRMYDLGVQTPPLPFRLPLHHPVDRIRNVLDGDVHGTILEPFTLSPQPQAGPSELQTVRRPLPHRKSACCPKRRCEKAPTPTRSPATPPASSPAACRQTRTPPCAACGCACTNGRSPSARSQTASGSSSEGASPCPCIR